jgi:uroporphyrin-III C-methyltransferase
MTAPGKVVLVGAGPGAADLLTLRAARALAEADVVLYDALVDADALSLAPRAAKLYVGKRAGREHISQEGIHRLLVRLARSGRRVVRLKCGDPFVLGRGGEEVLALGEAGVAVEVIPGVSSAVAGPADVGIPVTLRGVASSFLVVTAVPEGPCVATVARQDPSRTTVVVLMGLASRARLASALLDLGWSADVPAAIVLGASSPERWWWTGALAELGAAPLPDDRAHLPGLLVLGQVVAASEPLRAALGLAPPAPALSLEACRDSA